MMNTQRGGESSSRRSLADTDIPMKLNFEISKDKRGIYAVYIRFLKKSKVHRTVEINDGLYADMDKKGRIIGLEVLDPQEYGWI